MKVLFVDDDGDIAIRYQHAIERAGCWVKFCDTVQEALEVAHRGVDQFDVVILDVMLPWGTRYTEAETDGGLNTGALLYRDLYHYYPEAHFVVLTAYSHSQVPPGLKHSRVRVCNKGEYRPSKFAQLISGLGPLQ